MRPRLVVLVTLAACGPDPRTDDGDGGIDGATIDAAIDAIPIDSPDAPPPPDVDVVITADNAYSFGYGDVVPWVRSMPNHDDAPPGSSRASLSPITTWPPSTKRSIAASGTSSSSPARSMPVISQASSGNTATRSRSAKGSSCHPSGVEVVSRR